MLLVEHDEETIREADWIVDLGPRAGEHGGEVVAEGSVAQVEKAKGSLTASYLRGESEVPVPATRRRGNGSWLGIRGARQNNLDDLDVDLPLGCFVLVTGVSGSGKSSLVNEVLYKTLARAFYRAAAPAGDHDRIEGLDHLDKVIAIDQSPIGRTPRSNPATYTNLFTPIRTLMAKTTEARARGYKPGRFSFNVKGGRCEACAGDGQNKIEMHFLPDVYVTCDVCGGLRYDRETLQVRYKDKNIADILAMSVENARGFFANIPAIDRILSTLDEVGLGYIRLGQPATTLSGGEAQRVKLATELSKRATGRSLYLLDEPTTGLHFDDVRRPGRPAAATRRPGQHGAGRGAQPGRDQERGLDHRPRAGRWGRRRQSGGGRHAGAGGGYTGELHRRVPEQGAGGADAGAKGILKW